MRRCPMQLQPPEPKYSNWLTLACSPRQQAAAAVVVKAVVGVRKEALTRVMSTLRADISTSIVISASMDMVEAAVAAADTGDADIMVNRLLPPQTHMGR